MVMKPEPLFRAIEEISAERGAPSAGHSDDAAGTPAFRMLKRYRFSQMERLIIICGRSTKGWTNASPRRSLRMRFRSATC